MAGEGITTDLADLSRRNYLRHPYRRWMALAAGIGASGGFGLFAGVIFDFGTSHPGDLQTAYVLIAGCVLFAYLCFALGWWLFRKWAAPPVKIKVDQDGVEIGLRSGKTCKIGWDRPGARMDIVVRTRDSSVPSEARIWVVTAVGTPHIQMAWLPVVPDAFLPESAVGPILAAARARGKPIHEEVYAPGFPRNVSRSWTLYRIGPMG